MQAAKKGLPATGSAANAAAAASTGGPRTTTYHTKSARTPAAGSVRRRPVSQAGDKLHGNQGLLQRAAAAEAAAGGPRATTELDRSRLASIGQIGASREAQEPQAPRKLVWMPSWEQSWSFRNGTLDRSTR